MRHFVLVLLVVGLYAVLPFAGMQAMRIVALLVLAAELGLLTAAYFAFSRVARLKGHHINPCWRDLVYGSALRAGAIGHLLTLRIAEETTRTFEGAIFLAASVFASRGLYTLWRELR